MHQSAAGFTPSRATTFPVKHFSQHPVCILVLAALWPWPPGKPPPVSAPLGSALCRPVSVSDRVAPHAYIGLKSEHAACSVFSLSTELEPPPHAPTPKPPHPRPHCRSRTLYLYTATSSPLIFLVFGWKEQLSSRLLYVGKVTFFLSAALLSVFLCAIYSLDFRYFLWFARILPTAF